MKRLVLTTMAALCVSTGALLSAPSTAHADRDWDHRYNDYRQRWDNHRHWRNRYYQPYYQHHYYHSQPYSQYHSAYPRTYYRPNYGTYYYGSPYGGYRDYRSGGAVRVGPLQFYWR